MTKQSGVSWTDASWGPWYGCRKVSAGCKYCYAERDMARYGRNFSTVTQSKTKFEEPLQWTWPKRIFVCPWSDFFISDADEWRDDAWDVMRLSPQHTYIIPTKRPERIVEHLPLDWGGGWPHVWLGVSAENQEAVDLRLPQLIAAPAAVRFVSAEPLLGFLDLASWFWSAMSDAGKCAVNWVIVGGESGKWFREMRMEWARSIRDQCISAGVAFYFKQDAAKCPGVRPWLVERDGTRHTWHQYPDDLCVPALIGGSDD